MHSSQSLFLFFLFLLYQKYSSAYIQVGGNVGVWINGRPGSTTTAPTPSDPTTTTTPSKEYIALQTWKSAITEDPNNVLSSWVGFNVCSYKGVFCSPDSPNSSDQLLDTTTTNSNVVAAVDLNRANLKGYLVKELSLLTHLSILHLNTNRFTGTVPDSFKDFQYLTELDLSNNLFSGFFPTTTLYIPNLVYLDLRFNQFSGEVPAELFMKQELDAIFLNNNMFEGQIPASLWASSASVITLANNKFSGTIPAGFSYMGSRLREVLFLNNKLSGCIPEGLGYISTIEVLDLSFNALAGHVPGSLSCLPGIEVLNVGHNQLSGLLPDLCQLRSLLNLTVAFNFLSGFGQECGKSFLRNVLGFDFSGNCIPGGYMQRPPPECNGSGGSDGVELSCLRIPIQRPAVCMPPVVGGVVGIPYALVTGTLPPVLP